jgi:Fe(3+) dicitrate transport protein
VNRSVVVTMTVAATMTIAATATTPALADQDAVRLPEIEVRELAEPPPGVPDVEGVKIFQGKKVTVVDLDEQPPVVNNNYRQAFNELPGLLVSEMQAPAHVNLNYRGIGDPHESEFLLMLRDGVPMKSDWFGYATTYYHPALESVEKIEFIRGGSSLLYGPQPGPVINYITRRPPLDRPFTASTAHTVGSHGLYSTYNSAGGTVGRLGYLGSFHHRQADGPRDNADYSVYDGELKLALDAATDTRWYFGLYAFQSESGEAGRLTLEQYRADRDQTVKPNDRIWIKRYVPSLTLEQDISEDTLLVVKGWAGWQDRLSRRQGTFMGMDVVNIDRREFFFIGADARLSHHWEAWDNDHTLSGGAVFYAADAPRSRERSTNLKSRDGDLVFDLDNNTLYGSLFAESRFQFGNLGVIPAVRLEFIHTRVEENLNLARGDMLRSDFSDVVPLPAIGLTYDLPHAHRLYANLSRGYRPPSYDDLVNPTATAQRASSPDPGNVWNYELGVRGAPWTWLNYDTSLFYVDWDDFVETLDLGGGDLVRSNSGRARFYGWEAAAELDIVGLVDHCRHSDYAGRIGSFSIHGSVSLLNAKFVSGLNEGNRPAYAPGHIIKAGATWRLRDRAKLSLLGVFVDKHFWQDNNTEGLVGTARIPSYGVWDLVAEANVYKDHLSVFAGINNLFNEDYFSRVRSDGIEPALERTYYIGAKLSY